MRRRYPATAIFQPRTDPAVLKFRKYLHLKKSAMHLLYSDKINPITMRQPLKKFIKTNLLNFKSRKSFLASSTGYMCPHLRGITIEAEEREWYSACLRKKTRKLPNYLKRCKNLENLQIYQKLSPTLRSSLRYLHQLKSLVLVIYEIDMKVNPNMLRDLSYLREVSLKVKRDQQSLYQTLSITPPGELLFPRIFQQLMSLRYLTKIELDLEELSDPDNTQVIESVLSHLGVSNADFKIKLCLTNRVLDVEKIRKVLARTDTLVLQYQKKWQNDLEGHQKLEPERTRITRQGHRVLHFIHKEAGEVDFLRFIEECHELETLWIEAERSQSIVLRQFSFPKTLKNLFTVLPYLNTKMATTFLSYLIPALKNVKTVETLFFAVPVQESLSQIDKLKNFECIQNSTKYHLTVCFIPTSFIGQLYGNALISLCSPITTMSSLKSLRLDFERTLVAPVDCIQRVLDSLPKLQQFELVISAYNGPKTFDLYFPFESMSELTEFRLDLCNPLSTSAIYQFMKGFSKMKELEVMVIKGECFVDPEFKLQEIVDELVEMEKLRELWIGNKLLSLKGYQKIRKEEMGLKSYQINNRFRSW